MDHPTQVALLRRLFAFSDAGTTEMGTAPATNPTASYTSPAQLARERAALFGREPLLVALGGDLPVPGSYLVHEDGGVPVLLVRRQDGTVAAFVALCRHRGAQVAAGSGTCRGRFTCPYHGWTYDDAGRLVAQPTAEGFAGIATGDLGLRSLPVAERHGMIFVRGVSDAPGAPIDVDAHLGGATAELAPFDLAQYVAFARHRTERAMNWKLVIDGFLEAYHVPMLHSQTLGPGILGAPAAWDAFGRSGRMIALRRSFVAERDKPEAERRLLPHAVVLYALFPNTVLIHQIDHVELVQVYPGRDPDHAVVIFTLYTPGAVTTDGARRHFQRNWDVLVRTIEDEDFRIGEAMQRGFHAAGSPPVIYGRNEPGLAHFHAAIAAALDAAERG